MGGPGKPHTHKISCRGACLMAQPTPPIPFLKTWISWKQLLPQKHMRKRDQRGIPISKANTRARNTAHLREDSTVNERQRCQQWNVCVRTWSWGHNSIRTLSIQYILSGRKGKLLQPGNKDKLLWNKKVVMAKDQGEILEIKIYNYRKEELYGRAE